MKTSTFCSRSRVTWLHPGLLYVQLVYRLPRPLQHTWRGSIFFCGTAADRSQVELSLGPVNMSNASLGWRGEKCSHAEAVSRRRIPTNQAKLLKRYASGLNMHFLCATSSHCWRKSRRAEEWKKKQQRQRTNKSSVPQHFHNMIFPFNPF